MHEDHKSDPAVMMYCEFCLKSLWFQLYNDEQQHYTHTTRILPKYFVQQWHPNACMRTTSQILLWWCIVNSVWNHYDLSCIMMSSSITSIQHESFLNTLFISHTLMHPWGPQVRSCCDDVLWILSEITRAGVKYVFVFKYANICICICICIWNTTRWNICICICIWLAYLGVFDKYFSNTLLIFTL